jgi:hypothetical protein
MSSQHKIPEPKQEKPPQKPVGFTPANDQVLLKMDVKKRSVLEVLKEKPTVLPSGVVVAVGKGVFIGTGWAGSQFEPGDHVAVSLDGGWLPLPLTDRKDEEVFFTISESMILGKLHNADEGSPWFTAADEAPTMGPRLVAPGQVPIR